MRHKAINTIEIDYSLLMAWHKICLLFKIKQGPHHNSRETIFLTILLPCYFQTLSHSSFLEKMFSIVTSNSHKSFCFLNRGLNHSTPSCCVEIAYFPQLSISSCVLLFQLFAFIYPKLL